MIVRKVSSPEDGARINEIFAIAFEQKIPNCPYNPEEGLGHYWAAFNDDDEMTSSITVSDFDIRFDKHVCRMGGVGAVETLPQYRRGGGVRGCFNEALRYMYDNGYDFSYLYPFSTAYYRQFGFECCVQKFGWEVNTALLPKFDTGCTFRLAENRNPMTDEIRAVDKVWEERYNMMVQHDEKYYKWTLDPKPGEKQEFTYVCFDTEGKPNAYATFKCVYEADGRNHVCSRFRFVDKLGFEVLMQLFKTMAADHAYVKFETPCITSLQYMLPEWSLGATKWNIHFAGMVRAVNVKSVLEKASYRGSGSAVIKIKDAQLSENNCCFEVKFAGGKAERVSVSESAPDCVMEISKFSALISGVCDFDEALDGFGAVELINDNPALRGIFYRKPLMITDFF